MAEQDFRVTKGVLVDGAATAAGQAIGVTKGSVLLTDGYYDITSGPRLGMYDSGGGTTYGYLTTSAANLDIKIAPHGTGNLLIEADTIDISAEASILSIKDNEAVGFDIKEGSSSYLKFVTSNGAEKIRIGQDVDIYATDAGTSAIAVEAVAHDETGNALTISGGSTVATTTDNKAGGGVTILTGQGKGILTGGDILFRSSPAGTAGVTGYPLNSYIDALRIKASGEVQMLAAKDLRLSGPTSLGAKIAQEADAVAVNADFNVANLDRSDKVMGTPIHDGWTDASLVISSSTNNADIFFSTTDNSGDSHGQLKLKATENEVIVGGYSSLVVMGSSSATGGKISLRERATAAKKFSLMGPALISSAGNRSGVTETLYTLPDRIGTEDDFTTANAHGQVLKIASSPSATASAATLEWGPITIAADDITLGDAAVTIDTSSGDMNIGTGAYNKTITYGVDSGTKTVHHVMQGSLQNKRSVNQSSTGVIVDGAHAYVGTFIITVKTVAATTLTVGDRLYSSGGDFIGAIGHIYSTTEIWIAGGTKRALADDEVLYLGAPTTSIYADYTDDNSNDWLPADDIGSRLSLITNHTYGSLTDAEAQSMQAGVLDFYASGGKVTNANSSKQHVHHIGSIESRYDYISNSASMLKKTGTMDFKVSTQSTTHEPVRGLRIIGSNRVTHTGVRVNNASNYAVGATVVAVDTVLASPHWAVGDMVYLTDGKAVGLLSARTDTELRFAQTGIYEALNDDDYLFAGAGRVDVEIGATTDSVTTINGNLIISGDFTTMNTATLDVEDINITVAKGAGSSSAANNAGLTVDIGGSNPTLLYKNTGTKWQMNRSLNLTSGLDYQIAGTTVLDASGLSVGAITGEVAIDTYTTIGSDYLASVSLIGTNTGAVAQVVGEYDYSTHRSGKFMVQLYNVTDNNSEFYEVLVTYDGASAPAATANIHFTTYGAISAGATLGELSVLKNSSGVTKVQLLYTSTTATDATIIVRSSKILTKI